MREFPHHIVMEHEGVRISLWKSRGMSVNGSGMTYLHQQFKTAHDGRQIVVIQERPVFSASDVRSLLTVPGVRVVEEVPPWEVSSVSSVV